ncbi:hypothetical protein CNY89_04300, partial [Amaricoccus sp. HAR-UPW-R2A-40]
MSLAGLEQPDLVTTRLRLRRLVPADAALVHLYASDARVATMTTSIPHPNPEGASEAFVQRVHSLASPFWQGRLERLISSSPTRSRIWASSPIRA